MLPAARKRDCSFETVQELQILRSSHRKCSIKKLFLKTSCNLILKNIPTQVFFYEYCEIFKNTYFEEHLRTAASEHFQPCSSIGRSRFFTTLFVIVIKSVPLPMLYRYQCSAVPGSDSMFLYR